MTQKDAAQIIARVFLRFPSHRLDDDTRKGVLAVWGTELMHYFSDEPAPNVLSWAEEACRGFASPFPPALDQLVEAMIQERDFQRRREAPEKLPKSEPQWRLEDMEENKVRVKEEVEKILLAIGVH